MKWLDENSEKWFYNEYNVNMMIIVFFIILLIISEIIKKRKNINLIKHRSPSLLNFIIEFKSSWSIINSFRACGANSSYLLIFFLLIYLFLSDSPFKLIIFQILSFLLLYILLPLLDSIITRIFLFINDDSHKRIISEYNKEYVENKNNNELLSFSSENVSKHFLNKSIREFLYLIFNCFEILLCFETLDMVVEFICFVPYACLYASGEDSYFNV